MMKINRRQFIKRLIILLVSLEAFFLIEKGISKKLIFKKKKNLVPVGKAELFDKNKTYPFITNHFYLRRFDDGGFLAFSVKCTHLGCVVNLNKETDGFICPCHSSKFDQFGEVTSSPANRPLDIFPVIVEKGELFVDVNKPMKRDKFEKSQLTYVS